MSSSPRHRYQNPMDYVPPPEKPRLTEAEKKSNHIASEQKRRAAIREGFDRLAELTPGMEGQGRSEGLVLQKVVEYAKDLVDERRKLIEEVEGRGGRVERELKKF
ncbi:MAG: hypothetical protein MMC33_008826 [Icmadophila ericetorum]|nr:hypothetical protein [Icmadophila ericetorum]